MKKAPGGREKRAIDRGREAGGQMRRVLHDWKEHAKDDPRFAIHPQAVEMIAGMVESHVWLAVLNDRAARARRAKH
jgi:hypothetical protein